MYFRAALRLLPQIPASLIMQPSPIHTLLLEDRAEREQPLVSIVIVCYNQAHYLEEAIESALSQSHRPLEILVVDDGSTDDTGAVAASYPRVRYIRQTNRGLAAARNTGLANSAGEYVVFLDADDKLLAGALEAGLGCFHEFPDSAFVSGTYRNIFSDGSPAPTGPAQFIENDHYCRLLEGNYIGMHAAVLYRRDVLAATGGFNESLRACEDYELYLRIARQFPVSVHREVIAEYRQHDTNMSKDRAFMLQAVLSVLQMESRRVPDPRHRSALQCGRRVWQDYYGYQLLEEWRKTPHLSGLIRLLRLCPRQTLRRAASVIAQKLARKLRPRRVRFGSLRRLTPVSRQFGFDRGRPIDRYYIESFLAEHAHIVGGHVLEVGDDTYSRQFGGARITGQDVLHVVPGHPEATPSNRFNCIILTQTMHYIFDLPAAAATLHRILKPGGTLLVTLPGISQICRDQSDKESDCWRFTAASAARLFEKEFSADNVHVRTYGNVLASIAFLEGLAAEDLTHDELAHQDPDYQLTIAVAARKEPS